MAVKKWILVLTSHHFKSNTFVFVTGVGRPYSEMLNTTGVGRPYSEMLNTTGVVDLTGKC